MDKIFNVQLDLTKNSCTTDIENIVSQDGTNVLKITILDNFKLINLDGHTAKIFFKNTKGDVFEEKNVTINNNVITSNIALEVLQSAGRVEAEVALYLDDKKSTSCLFSFNVRKSLDDANCIVPSNQLPNYRKDMENLDIKFDDKVKVLQTNLETDINKNKQNIISTNGRIDNLIVESGNADVEVADAHFNAIENKKYLTLGERLNEDYNNTVKKGCTWGDLIGK